MPPRGVTLYHRLLRLHRSLPDAEMRRLGDSYIREEFRKHRSAQPAFLPAFFAAWEGYAAELEAGAAAAPTAASPAPLGSGDLRAELSEEQRETLERLRLEVLRAAAER